MFPYKWHIKNGYPAEGVPYHASKVFSCFGGGGGSSMGYKLAGYDVVGTNEIDEKMAADYVRNHGGQNVFIEPIQTFKNRKNLPKELFDLTILDGSPPCSSFSTLGNRDKDWGKNKAFREGQSKQVLDTLFFDFLELADRLKPKIIIAENVKGILQGKARIYAKKVVKTFNEIGYKVKVFQLNGSQMGVPQERERVFFIGVRNDLARLLPQNENTLFDDFPALDLHFNYREIAYAEIEADANEKPVFKNPSPCYKPYYDMLEVGEHCGKYHPKKSFFSTYKIDPSKPLKTINANGKCRGGALHYDVYRVLTKSELYKAQTFPLDYQTDAPYYVCGMSVPPVMIAQVAYRIWEQWIEKFL